MITDRSPGGWEPANWAPERVVTEIRAADAAAVAARRVPGVARLQPGLVGLLRQFAALAWEQATGQDLPDLAGVDADLDDSGTIALHLQIVVEGGYQAAAVGAAVHAEAVVAAEAAVHRPVTARVLVVEVELDDPA